jgi:hypothetical protein
MTDKFQGSPEADRPAGTPEDNKTKRKGSLADFFAASPLRNSGLIIERDQETPRDWIA